MSSPPENLNQDLWDAYENALTEIEDVVKKSEKADVHERKRVIKRAQDCSNNLLDAAESLSRYAGVDWSKVEELEDRLADIVRAVENGWTGYACSLVSMLDGFISEGF